MALSGWGLTPGTMEKNVTRSLGGKYGAVGNSPTTVSDMMRQKYAAGLQAKSAKEQFDFTKTAEENRKAESARDFGLTSEKFALTKTQADQAWDMAQRQYELDKLRVTNASEQAALDRALEQKKLEISNAFNEKQLAQSGSQFDRGLDQSGSQFKQNLDQNSSQFTALQVAAAAKLKEDSDYRDAQLLLSQNQFDYNKAQDAANLAAQAQARQDALSQQNQARIDASNAAKAERTRLILEQRYAKQPSYSSGGTTSAPVVKSSIGGSRYYRDASGRLHIV